MDGSTTCMEVTFEALTGRRPPEGLRVPDVYSLEKEADITLFLPPLLLLPSTSCESFSPELLSVALFLLLVQLLSSLLLLSGVAALVGSALLCMLAGWRGARRWPLDDVLLDGGTGALGALGLIVLLTLLEEGILCWAQGKIKKRE